MTELPPWIEDTLGSIDAVHAVFDQQDSGNVGFGITQGRHRGFVKVATTEVARDGLIRAATLHNTVQHPNIVPLVQVLRSTYGTALLYPWVDGRLLYAVQKKRKRKRSAPGRFRELPVERIAEVLDALFDAHCTIAAAGFVSSDFYDGCLIYDFDAHRLHIIDLDEYRPGPFELQTERAFGSTRFMAPEEFRRGAVIDQRTTVFHMARAASILLDEGDDPGAFRGSEAVSRVVLTAQSPDPDDRHPTVADFTAAFRAARSG